MINLITIALLFSVTQAQQVIYSNQMLPYCPVHLSNGQIAYPTKVVQHTFPIPKGCTKWSDGCTECTVFNGALRHCSTNPHCKFTSCLPVCIEFHEVRRIPEDCVQWQDSCQHTCEITAERTQYISTINGRRFIRDIYKNIQAPCTDYKWCVWQGQCSKRRTCMLPNHLHAEAQTKYMAFDHIYTGLGYSTPYVPTYHTTPYTSNEMVVPDGSMYYAPKVNHVLGNDLKQSYSNIIQNQFNNIMQHEVAIQNADVMKEAKVQSHVIQSELYGPHASFKTGHTPVHQNTYAVNSNGAAVTSAIQHDTSMQMSKDNVPTHDTMYNMPIASQHSMEVAQVASHMPAHTTVATAQTHAMPGVHTTAMTHDMGHGMGYNGPQNYYQWEHEKNMLDQLRYRIDHGAMGGYYYNPYETHSVYTSQPSVYNAPPTYMDAYGNLHTPLPTASTVNDGASAESEESDLTDAEIAGIAVGSVVAGLLLVCLTYYCLCNNNNRRRGTQTQMVQYTNQRMGPPNMNVFNTNQSDMTGMSDNAPDILDYNMQKNYMPDPRRQKQMY